MNGWMGEWMDRWVGELMVNGKDGERETGRKKGEE